MSPAFKSAAAVAALGALAARAADNCDLEFNIVSIAQTPSFFGSEFHQAYIKSLDGQKPEGVVAAGCTLNWFGGGCTWQKSGDSAVGSSGFTVSHGPYNAFNSNGADVTITGNDCDGTKLLCKGVPVTVTPVEPGDGSGTTLLYTAQVICRLERPEDALGQPSGETYAQLIQGYNDFESVDIPLPADANAQYTAVSDAPQPGSIACSFSEYDPEGCFDEHWYCQDSAGGAAYPPDAQVQYTMTLPPDTEPTNVIGECTPTEAA